MTATMTPGGRSRNLVLAAMIFAVSMTFIDQTIVSIAAPQIQRHLGLTSTGVQWAINAYLMSLAALFAFGGRAGRYRRSPGHGHPGRGRVRRRVGHVRSDSRRGSRPRPGSWPSGSSRAPAGPSCSRPRWPSWCRRSPCANGAGPWRMFFGIAGASPPSVRSSAGFLTEWTWRAIFWVNIPVAIIALVLIVVSKPATAHESAPMDYRGVGPDRRRCGPERVRFPAVVDLGVGESRHRAEHRRRGGHPGHLRLRRGAHGLAAHEAAHLPHPGLPGREPRPRYRHAGLRPGVLLRQRVRPDRAGATRPRRPACSCCSSSSASSSTAQIGDGSSTGAGPSARWSSAVPWPPWGSTSGPGT